MRNADLVTVIRTIMILASAYLIIYKFNPFAIILIIAVAMLLDSVDGYFAVREVSEKKVSFLTYSKSIMGNQKAREQISELKHKVSKAARFGPRIDIAGDRIAEYVMWIVFTYLNVIPLFVIFIIVIRHSLDDALLAYKGTSSKMKSKLARSLYASNSSRAGIQILKFVTFSYLVLVYISDYPVILGYILTAALVTFILVRGAAEIYESVYKE